MDYNISLNKQYEDVIICFNNPHVCIGILNLKMLNTFVILQRYDSKRYGL